MKAAALEDTDWHEDAVSTLLALADRYALITADDLRREMRPAPHCNHVGAAFTAAKRLGYIEPVSYTTSNTTTRRHGALRTCGAARVKESSRESRRLPNHPGRERMGSHQLPLSHQEDNHRPIPRRSQIAGCGIGVRPMIALILAAAIMAAVFIRWAVVNDEYDAHVLHGPDAGCWECDGK